MATDHAEPAVARPSLLNLGSGGDYRDGWHNVDIDPSVDPDETVDLSQTPWPFPGGQFSHVDAQHVLEHLDPVPWDELARILVPDGELTVTYPIGHTRFEDTTHEQFWNYYSAEQIAGERKHSHEVDAPLSLISTDITWHIDNVEPVVWLYTRYRLLVRGPGPWLSQIPGLAGEVTAVYQRTSE